MKISSPLLRSGSLAIVALLTLSACATAADDAGEQGGVSPGGTLVYAADVEPPCLDPHKNGSIANAVISQNITEPLVYQSADGTYLPWLAESWDVSADGLEYTFQLRKDVSFHDGAPFNAEAVKTNLDHWTAPETKSSAGLSLQYVETKIVDEFTATIVLATAQAATMQSLSLSSAGMISPTSITEQEAALCAGGPALAGTGPFEFESYTKGETAVLSKYEGYVGNRGNTDHEGAAFLDKIEIRFLPESGVRLGALSSDQAQIVGNVAVLDAVGIDADTNLQLLRAATAGASYGLYLNDARAPFSDPKVREALQRGLDIDGLVSSIYVGKFDRSWSPLLPNTPPSGSFEEKLVGSWPTDTKLANELLDAAGWDTLDSDGYRTNDGTRLTVTWAVNGGNIKEQRDVLGDAIVADAKKLGIDIKRQVLDPGAYSEAMKASNYDIADLSLQRSEADILAPVFLSTRTPADNGYNYAQVSDPEIDQLLDEASTGEAGKRAENYRKVQQMVIDDANVVPIYDPAYLIGAQASVEGIKFTVAGYPDWFYDVQLAK